MDSYSFVGEKGEEKVHLNVYDFGGQVQTLPFL